MREKSKMAEEDITKELYDIFEKEIVFNEKNYSKVKERLDFNRHMHLNVANGCIVYLTNHLSPNQMPYGIILQRRGSWGNFVGVLSIQKNHPLGEKIKKSLGELLKD
jgi:hypothetical protein